MIQNQKDIRLRRLCLILTDPFIGHLGVYVPSDIYSRYLRLQGRDVLFVCGSDEHGVAISMKAKKDYTASHR
jgi:methionyl-tRNA synthetase